MRRLFAIVVLPMALFTTPRLAHGNGEPVASGAPVLTHFERFILSGCSPCVKESHLVKAIAIAPTTLPQFPRFGPGAQSRAGEITFEVVRAWELGRAARQSLAAQVTLSVETSPSGGALFPLGSGVLDADDVALLADAVSGMAKAAAPGTSGAEKVDIEFHAGSLRVGVMRIRDRVVAYFQAGDLALLATRPVWEVRNTLFLPLNDLSALSAVITEVAAKIRTLRGG
jgi:hypothetical protein